MSGYKKIGSEHSLYNIAADLSKSRPKHCALKFTTASRRFPATRRETAKARVLYSSCEDFLYLNSPTCNGWPHNAPMYH